MLLVEVAAEWIRSVPGCRRQVPGNADLTSRQRPLLAGFLRGGAGERGEAVIIARGKTPVARLTRLRPVRSRRRFGAMRGRAKVTPAFFEPLPPEETGEQS